MGMIISLVSYRVNIMGVAGQHEIITSSSAAAPARSFKTLRLVRHVSMFRWAITDSSSLERGAIGFGVDGSNMFVELLASSCSMFTKSDYLKSQNLGFRSHPFVNLNSVAVALFTNRFFIGIRLLATSYGIKTMQFNTKPIPSKIDESLIHHCLHYCDILCF